MPKHILFISSWYPTSDKKSHGIFFKRHAEAAALCNEISSIHVCSGIKNEIKESTEQHVFTIIGTYKKVNSNIPLLSAVLKMWRSLVCFKKCFYLLLDKKSAPNLILLNVIFPAGIFALWLYYFKQIPFVIQEQWSGYYPEDGNYKGFIIKTLTEQCVKKAKGIIVVSNKLENSMKAHGLQNKYFRIGNVVDTEMFVPIEHKQSDTFKFVHVSTVNDKEKNISGIIKAVELLSRKQLNFSIDIVGDGPERDYFERMAQSHCLLGSYIFFHGFQLPNAVAKSMGLANCFILNSNYEGLPCVLLEAMSCGIPVISTKVGAVPEIIDQHQGMLVPINDYQTLANAMESMIQNNKEYNQSEIRKRVIEKYSYPAIAKDFDLIFKTVLEA
jgi:glycosyltransferase involved in cell wall biosynthesis